MLDFLKKFFGKKEIVNVNNPYKSEFVWSEFVWNDMRFQEISEIKEGIYINAYKGKKHLSVGRISSKEKGSSYSEYFNEFIPNIKYVKVICLEKDESNVKLSYTDIKGKSKEEIDNMVNVQLEKYSKQVYLAILDDEGDVKYIIEDCKW